MTSFSAPFYFAIFLCKSLQFLDVLHIVLFLRRLSIFWWHFGRIWSNSSQIFSSFDSKRTLLFYIISNCDLGVFSIFTTKIYEFNGQYIYIFRFLSRLSIHSSLFRQIWSTHYEDICKFHFIACVVLFIITIL